MSHSSTLIDSSQMVERIVARGFEDGRVAIDTELLWERTYYPRLAIVQIALSEEEWYLVDAAIPDILAPLGPLLEDVSVVKILHDAAQDLAVLRRATGRSPRSIYDTRVAAGFAGLSSTVSLGTLLLELMEVELPKTETRTDWFQRPLTQSQIDYAADDVRFLVAAQRVLTSRARDRGVEQWLSEELAMLDDPGLYAERDERLQYERVKGSGRLTRQQLAVLRELTAWREEEARLQDRPRGRISSDKMLLRLATRPPRTEEDMETLKSFRGARHRRHRADILQAVEVGLAVGQEDCPQPPPRSRFDRTFAQRADSAIGLLEERSAQHRIDHALVATRSEVRALLRDGGDAKSERHRLLNGWRWGFLGRDLLELARNSA